MKENGFYLNYLFYTLLYSFYNKLQIREVWIKYKNIIYYKYFEFHNN